jgi:hypothetical protein
MAISSKATTSEDKLLRKRLNARVRQQRCRSRKREASLVKKIGLAQHRSHQVSRNLNSSDHSKSKVSARQVDPNLRHPAPHFRVPFHPGMQFCGPPMHPGMGFPPPMMPPHMMMAMRMGGPVPPMSMPPMSMHPMSMPGPGRMLMKQPMSPGRPVTVSRTTTEESSEDSPHKAAPKGGVKPSPKTEAAALDGLLSLRSSSSSESSDSEEDASTLKTKDHIDSPVKAVPAKKGTSSKKPAKKRPVTVFVLAGDAVDMPTSLQATAASMPWPVGLDGPSVMIRPSAAVPV